jgi:hypothetical protein
MFPAAAADHRPVFLVSHGGDGAGIDNITVAIFSKRGGAVTQILKNLLHCLRFVLIDLTAKSKKTNFHCQNHQ